MTEKDFETVSSKIEKEKEFLNSISQDIWRSPELGFKEVKAHAILTDALKKYGFRVQEHYFMDTAFRAEHSAKINGGPTIAVLCEYDALPGIGHACGHNLIAEMGVATAVAVKTVMDTDPTLAGKLVVLGTPAEESGGGKIRLIERGAFNDIDAALMSHPTKDTIHIPDILCIVPCFITYKGKAAHASSYPWEGRNALDAAVACYNNISMLRQQIKPTCRIHGIIRKGGVAANIIPGEGILEYYIRATTVGETEHLRARVQACITSAAEATGCDVTYKFDHGNYYQNLISNKPMASLYKKFGLRLGMEFWEDKKEPKNIPPSGSTDMGNVSHVVPSIHPNIGITGEAFNHTPDFTKASGSKEAQPPILASAIAMAMTILSLMRSEEVMQEVKREFVLDLARDRDTV